MIQPTPVALKMCGHCGEPWDLHIRSATNRIAYERDDDDYDDLVVADTDVTLEDCVNALRERNRGPMGPPGAMGPMGMSAA